MADPGGTVELSRSQRKRRRGIDAIRAFDRERNKRPERVAQILLVKRRWRLAHPAEYAAQNAVTYALRQGRLKKEPCRDCGNPKAVAHHPDYSKPLDVVWLCHQHHTEEHQRMASP